MTSWPNSFSDNPEEILGNFLKKRQSQNEELRFAIWMELDKLHTEMSDDNINFILFYYFFNIILIMSLWNTLSYLLYDALLQPSGLQIIKGELMRYRQNDFIYQSTPSFAAF